MKKLFYFLCTYCIIKLFLFIAALIGDTSPESISTAQKYFSTELIQTGKEHHAQIIIPITLITLLIIFLLYIVIKKKNGILHY